MTPPVLGPRGGDIISRSVQEDSGMPLYEYVCASCRGRFERYLRAWGEAVTCPSCQGTQVEKQLSTFACTGTDRASPSSGGGCGCGRGGCRCGH